MDKFKTNYTRDKILVDLTSFFKRRETPGELNEREL